MELDTPVGEYSVDLETQVSRPGETATVLYTDTLTGVVTAAEIEIVEEVEQHI